MGIIREFIQTPRY